MRAVEGVQLESLQQRARHKLLPDLVLGVQRVRRQVRHERGEPLIEPEMCPPLRGDQVPEPLVRSFVTHRTRHQMLAGL